MEQLLLGAILAGEELDVVHQQDGRQLPVALAELRHPTVAEGVNEIIGESLRSHVEDV